MRSLFRRPAMNHVKKTIHLFVMKISDQSPHGKKHVTVVFHIKRHNHNRNLHIFYTPLDGCISKIPKANTWPTPWPQRLKSKPKSLPTDPDSERIFSEDTKHWSELVKNFYIGGLGVNWSKVRNVMDMNAGYGGLVILTALLFIINWWQDGRLGNGSKLPHLSFFDCNKMF